MRRAEAELLVALARVSLDGTAAARVQRLISSGIRWDRFLAEVDWHGLVPLADMHLGSAAIVPPAVRSSLGEAARRAATRNLNLAARLVEIEGVLADRGVVAVPFKGPVFAASAYGNIALRQSLDLDLVVRRRDGLRAKRLLEAAGFIGGPTSVQMLNAWVRYGRSVTMTRWDGLVVDLQWATDLAERLDTDALFGRLGTVELGGSPLPMFSDEDTLLLLCVHGAKHLWSHLYWITDIAELASSRPDLDWDRLLADAERAGMRRRLLVGLALAQNLRALELPARVDRAMLGDPEGRSIAERLWSRLFDSHDRSFPLSSLHVRMRDSPRDGMRFAWRLAVTPTDGDWDWLQLPGRIWWAYPLLRPLRLVAQHGRRSLGGG